MTTATATTTTLPAAESTAGLIDLSGFSLRELWTASDTVLDASLERVVAAAEEQPQKAVSAFNSAI